VLEAVTVNVDDASTRDLVEQWEARELPVPLKVVESPYREITKPVIDYVKRARSDNPRNVVTVFIPEYVVGHWWEQILHNQSALRIKARLLFEPGVMVTSVPWQARSSVHVAQREELAPGAVRWGMNTDRAAKPSNSTPGTSTPASGPPAGAAAVTPPPRGGDRP
jgi:hypothetical protein